MRLFGIEDLWQHIIRINISHRTGSILWSSLICYNVQTDEIFQIRNSQKNKAERFRYEPEVQRYTWTTTNKLLPVNIVCRHRGWRCHRCWCDAICCRCDGRRCFRVAAGFCCSGWISSLSHQVGLCPNHHPKLLKRF